MVEPRKLCRLKFLARLLPLRGNRLRRVRARRTKRRMFRRFVAHDLPVFNEPKNLLFGLLSALAVRVRGRLLSRVTTALRFRRFFECSGVIAFAVQIRSGLMRLGSGFMILGGFRVTGHRHRISPNFGLHVSTAVS